METAAGRQLSWPTFPGRLQIRVSWDYNSQKTIYLPPNQEPRFVGSVASFERLPPPMSEEGMSLPAANCEQEGNVVGAKHPSQHSSYPVTALCRVRGGHLRSMPESTASTFIELQHPKQKW